MIDNDCSEMSEIRNNLSLKDDFCDDSTDQPFFVARFGVIFSKFKVVKISSLSTKMSTNRTNLQLTPYATLYFGVVK